MPKAERGYPTGHMTIYDTTLGWRYPNPRLEALFPLEQMGETAENIYELSLQGGVTGGPITREAQDAFAVESQRRAVETMRSGRFNNEIVPVQIPQRKGRRSSSILTNTPAIGETRPARSSWTPALSSWPSWVRSFARAAR